MKKILLCFVLSAFSEGAFSQSCKYKENCNCQVQGSTEKWHLAYCSYKTENENLESEAVRKCMSTTFSKGGDACAQNAYWKEEMCKVFHKTNFEKRERCIRKPFIPKIVGN